MDEKEIQQKEPDPIQIKTMLFETGNVLYTPNPNSLKFKVPMKRKSEKGI